MKWPHVVASSCVPAGLLGQVKGEGGGVLFYPHCFIIHCYVSLRAFVCVCVCVHGLFELVHILASKGPTSCYVLFGPFSLCCGPHS